MIRLGVNIDHCATLRQVRLADYPSILECAQEAKKGGADQITIHLREDRRHIQETDVKVLCRWGGLPINVEIAPNEAEVARVLRYGPQALCFVPERRRELTTEGGLDLEASKRFFQRHIPRWQSGDLRLSAFIEPNLKQVRLAAELGFHAVEFHTGSWVNALRRQARVKAARLWDRLVASARLAHELGLQVHAGHGLTYDTARLIRRLDHLEEVNIGHFLICQALFEGLAGAVSHMRTILERG